MDNLITSNIRQRPIRTLVSVAGIALGVCLVPVLVAGERRRGPRAAASP